MALLKTHKNHFIYMLVALLFFLVVVPVAEDHALVSEPMLRFIAFSSLLFVGVFSLRESGRVFRVGLVLAAAGITMNTLGISSFGGSFVHGSLITLFLFLLLAIWASMKRVLFSDDLSFDRVVGVVCVYLLLATIWAVLYAFAEIVAPGSFNGIEISGEGGWDTRWIYFSFVTLTTLGYGDVTPATNTTRVLVYTEAVSGVFYMAILVAGLVSAYLAKNQEKS
jgi:voltage-gated potassium channel